MQGPRPPIVRPLDIPQPSADQFARAIEHQLQDRHLVAVEHFNLRKRLLMYVTTYADGTIQIKLVLQPTNLPPPRLRVGHRRHEE